MVAHRRSRVVPHLSLLEAFTADCSFAAPAETMFEVTGGFAGAYHANKHLVIRVIEFAKSLKVLPQPRLSPFARAEDRDAWRVEGGRRHQAAPRHSQPAQAFADGVNSEQDLDCGQDVEGVLHAARIAEANLLRTS